VLGVVLLALRPAQALYSSSSPVIQLTPDNFDSQIQKKGGVWIVEVGRTCNVIRTATGSPAPAPPDQH
jgi:hypothetical protein